MPDIGRQADVAIVLGGDGTMLGIARQLAPYDVPLIGIKPRSFGFITDIPRDQMIRAVSEILMADISPNNAASASHRRA